MCRQFGVNSWSAEQLLYFPMARIAAIIPHSGLLQPENLRPTQGFPVQPSAASQSSTPGPWKHDLPRSAAHLSTMKPVSNSNSLQKVLDHLQLYEHPLLALSARDSNGAIEIVIDLKNSTVPVHTYVLPIHSRDLDHPQFAWHLQRQIYDGLHDYFIEMFIRTPQDRDNPLPAKEGKHGEGDQRS
jgi:hypothetical protein